MTQQRLRGLEHDAAVGGGDDTLLPAQFWAALADPRSEPEKRLMVAVLEEAIALVVNAHGGSDDRRSAVREARRWFASDDNSTPFAFATICDILGLDVGRVRQALARWPRRQRLFRRPRLQAGRGRHQVRTGERGPRRAA
jgi:DNA-directed RNA polymerase sigma subunit (sigma70/sigma32)